MKSAHDSKCFFFWNLIQIGLWPKLLSFFIQINSWLKRLSRILIQVNSRLENLECWFESTHYWVTLLLLGLCPIGFDLVSICLKLVPFDLTWCDLFGGFRGKCLPEILIRINSAVSRKAELIQLMTQVAFREIDSESTHNSSGCPGIDLDRLMTQATFQGINSESTPDSSGSPNIDSNRLMTLAKKNI